MVFDKKQLRKEFLAKRGAIAPSFIYHASRKIADFITSSREFKSANIISCYHPCRNEVDLLAILNNAPNKTFAFPRVAKGSKKLDFYAVKSTEDFEPGVFGLMEPKLSLPKINISDIDLFLVPGLAFTKSGGRLGYGGGYYDETLNYRKPCSNTYGICFDIQLAERLPSEAWDITMDAIITESGIIKSK